MPNQSAQKVKHIGQKFPTARKISISIPVRTPFTIQNAHKKGAGSTKNGHDSKGQRLGVKIYGDQVAKPGATVQSLFDSVEQRYIQERMFGLEKILHNQPGSRAVGEVEKPTAGSASWGISSIFGGSDSRSSVKENPANKLFNESVSALDHAFSMIHFREPPTVLRPLDAHSDQEAIEIHVTKLYFVHIMILSKKTSRTLFPRQSCTFWLTITNENSTMCSSRSCTGTICLNKCYKNPMKSPQKENVHAICYASFNKLFVIFHLTTPLYPAYFLPLASLGNLAKAHNGDFFLQFLPLAYLCRHFNQPNGHSLYRFIGLSKSNKGFYLSHLFSRRQRRTPVKMEDVHEDEDEGVHWCTINCNRSVLDYCYMNVYTHKKSFVLDFIYGIQGLLSVEDATLDKKTSFSIISSQSSDSSSDSIVISSPVCHVITQLQKSFSANNLMHDNGANDNELTRAFWVLKGIIRLQAVIRGHLVRRETLHCMRAIVEFQAIVRGQIVRLSRSCPQMLQKRTLQEHLMKERADLLQTSLKSEKLLKNVSGVKAVEQGLVGVVLKTEDVKLKPVFELKEHLDKRNKEVNLLGLTKATITRVEMTGMGDRVCVDLCSLMRPGEGLLVGSFSRGLFLVHSECIESNYIASRPFRVNAGPVHAYVAVPGGKTCYLSELKTGKEILVVDQSGIQRTAVVGRGGNEGTAIAVTSLKVRDQVLVRVQGGARHTGIQIQDFILEK
ncbi:hypothetical protein L2E82_19448 [Cichorium intybus]|uniref:Uncharacterized protein n=1 Tax=Cichorium intybus TaxID=13427 RepID=A0ACB9FCV3_CICIN|nr:hypothetical protein L2E82_19448 [Cichorium intybus]